MSLFSKKTSLNVTPEAHTKIREPVSPFNEVPHVSSIPLKSSDDYVMMLARINNHQLSLKSAIKKAMTEFDQKNGSTVYLNERICSMVLDYINSLGDTQPGEEVTKAKSLTQALKSSAHNQISLFHENTEIAYSAGLSTALIDWVKQQTDRTFAQVPNSLENIHNKFSDFVEKDMLKFSSTLGFISI
uniref:Uncharacterized protein n=1 Tax=Ditylenchus dipsaci TaxID=166011 RepID=A0A915E5Y8_9BILA